MYHFDPYSVLLAIATNTPVLFMTALVLQGHIHTPNKQNKLADRRAWIGLSTIFHICWSLFAPQHYKETTLVSLTSNLVQTVLFGLFCILLQFFIYIYLRFSLFLLILV